MHLFIQKERKIGVPQSYNRSNIFKQYSNSPYGNVALERKQGVKRVMGTGHDGLASQPEE